MNIDQLQWVIIDELQGISCIGCKQVLQTV